MYVGILGVGYWGVNILKNLIKNKFITKVFVFDSAGKDAILGLNSFQRKICYPSNKLEFAESYEDLLDDPLVKAIFIVTPASTHYTLAKKALQKNKNVFIEKPITFCPQELMELVKIAEEKNKIVFPSHTYLHTPEVKKIKRMINEKMLGVPLFYHSNRSNFGLFREDSNVSWDLAVHDIYIIKYLFGRRIVSLSAVDVKTNKNYPETACTINLNYDENFSASVFVSWLSPVKYRDITIVGSQGAFVYDDCLENDKLTYFKKEIPASLKEINYNEDKKIVVETESFEAISDQIDNLISLIINNDINNEFAYFSLDVINILKTIDLSIKAGGKPYAVPYY